MANAQRPMVAQSLVELLEVLDRHTDLQQMDQPQPRTQYVIRLTKISAVNSWDVFAGMANSWADLTHARRFEFATTATAYAIQDLDLATDQYTIEPV